MYPIPSDNNNNCIRLDWGGMTSISSDFNYLSDVIFFQIELQNQF